MEPRGTSDMDGKAKGLSKRERASRSADKLWIPAFLLS